jgi:hypothetical protein
MKAKEFIPASRPRNFVAKNQKTAGAGAHKDMKRAEKQGDIKHKKDLVPMEGWSDAYLAQRTGRPRTPYSVYIKGKKWKDFGDDDHARAVMDKLKAKFKADGRDPETITIAPTDYDKMSEGTVNPQFINVQVTKILAREAQRMTNAPIEQLLEPLMKEYNLTLQQINSMVPGGLKKAAGEYGVMVKGVAEGESALEKFRKSADEREKKHNDAEKEMNARHASGKEDMKGAIDRLEKQVNNK